MNTNTKMIKLWAGAFFLMQMSLLLACSDDKQSTNIPLEEKAVKVVNNTEEFDEILKAAGDTLIMVDLYADWCAPCRRLAPIIEQIARDHKSKVQAYKVNVDKNRKIAIRYGVQSIPLIIFIKNGKVVQSLIGLRSKDDYVKVINEYSSKAEK